MIVTRSGRRSEFAQAAGPKIFAPGAAIPSGNFVVEYLSGSKHFQAIALPQAVVQILAGWAFDVPGWDNLAEWRELTRIS